MRTSKRILSRGDKLRSANIQNSNHFRSGEKEVEQVKTSYADIIKYCVQFSFLKTTTLKLATPEIRFFLQNMSWFLEHNFILFHLKKICTPFASL